MKAGLLALTTFVIVFLVLFLLVSVWKGCSPDVIKVIKESNNKYECINGYMWKLHDNKKFKYQYLESGKPIPCKEVKK